VERKRIPVGIEELGKLSPGAGPEVLERALRLVETYVEEEATDRTAVLWGQRSQEDYSELVSESLSLSQADALVRARGYLGRMMEILQSIDVEAVSTAVRGGGGAVAEYLRGMNKKIDTLKELEAARVELDQLVKLMSAALIDLLDLKERIEKQSRRIDEIGDEVDAAALAALFLSDHESKRSPQLSRRFFERSMSLTQSGVQIRGSITISAVQIEQPLRLIRAIQDVALVTLPGWLGSIASLSVLSQGARKLTPTEAGELARQLRKIVEQLQA
jgi:ABC-type transporter Mla MlaB component